jgi:hypothetical protein
LAGGLVLVCSERKVPLAGCWGLVWSERKVLLADKPMNGYVVLWKKKNMAPWADPVWLVRNDGPRPTNPTQPSAITTATAISATFATFLQRSCSDFHFDYSNKFLRRFPV